MTDLITITNLRELDALVAERVLKIEVFRANGEYYEDMPGKRLIPKYSSDIAATLPVVVHCLSKDIELQILPIKYIGGWQINPADPSENAIAGTIAICLAALRSVGVEVDLKLGRLRNE